MTGALRFLTAGILAAVLFGGCGSDGGTTGNQSGLPTLGVLWQMVQDSTAPDSDGDYLPDDVEAVVGTNPADKDTDHDGLPDNYEIFGSGYFDDDDFVPDGDADGFVAPVDADDDHDGRNDGEVMDTDGDGVPNYLEYYGYTYDWMTERFVLWDGDPTVRHFRTDPLQRSTDQDAFPDGMEVSGAIMDVAVQGPGDDPLVPAYPNVVVQLEGYSVTLNETITYTEGGSLTKGTTWNRETTETHSNSTEKSWEVGYAVSAGFGTSGINVNPGWHANYGEKYTSTQTTSTAISVGGSVLSEKNWSRARSMNPTDAAHIKLFLKVHNFGTACASNIVPTLTLRIGGLNIATFEPGNAQVNVLVPGGEYPPDPGVQWVVDSIDTGTGVVPISVTMDELRALERGAPVSIAINQLKADVMLAAGDEGFSYAGDWNEYMARCDAVGANIRVDIGDGSFVHYVVYADDAPSAPRMTLEDALRCLGLDEEGQLWYYDKDGAPKTTTLAGYTFLFDQQTLIDNGWDLSVKPATPPSPEFEMADMVLGPDTSIFMKAPRDPGDDGPVIYYAYVDPYTGDVKVCAADYRGIDTVEMFDKDGEPTQMFEEMTDCGFFFLIPDPFYVWDGTEKVVVTNLEGETEERLLDVVFYPQPQEPVINFLTLDLSGRKLYANISNPAPQFPIQWVKALHPGFEGGFIELQDPVNAYEDPDGWVAELPVGWSAINIKVVAFVADGVYTEQIVSPESVITPLRVGTASLFADYDWTATNEWNDTAIDFDNATTRRGYHTNNNAYAFPAQWEMSHWWYDNNYWSIYFNAPFALVPGDFDDITRDDILGWVPQTVPGQWPPPGYSMGNIYALKTNEGNYVKVQLTSHDDDDSWWGEWRERYLRIKYVVYAPPSANAGPDRSVVVSPLHEDVQLNGAASPGANSFSWTLITKPPGSNASLSGASTATPSFTPDVAGLYVAKLVINGDSTLADTVEIDVAFPEANAGTDRFVTFNTGVDTSIEVDGSASTGADTWTWEWDSYPSADPPTILHGDTGTPEFVPTVSGDYVLTLTINNAEGTYESTATVTLTVTVN